MSINNYESSPGIGVYDPAWPRASEKTFTVEEFLKKLNTEKVPWETYNYTVRQYREWLWESKVNFTDGPLQLYKDDALIGSLVSVDVPFSVRAFEPYLDATVGDVQFIRECTGWLIAI